jgi:predicted AAA+ superfamily ATPase
LAQYANLNAVIDRIIEKDIPTLKSFTPEIYSKIPALMLILAVSDTQSLQNLATELKDIEVKTLSTVFRVLEDSELLVRVYPFSLSAPKKVRLPSKYLFLVSSLRAALLHLIDSRSIDLLHRGKLLEDAVGMYLYRHFKDTIGWTISYDAGKKGADFVVDGKARRIVVEAGWNKRAHQQVLNSLQNVKGTYGMVVSNSVVLGEKGNVLIVPFEYFFLL